MNSAIDKIKGNYQRACEVQPIGQSRAGGDDNGEERNSDAAIHKTFRPIKSGLDKQNGIGFIFIKAGIFNPKCCIGNNAHNRNCKTGNNIALIRIVGKEAEKYHKRAAKAHHSTHKGI